MVPAVAPAPIIVTIEYEDLMAFDPTKTPATKSPKDNLVAQIGAAFGPTGLGILAVRGVPEFAARRRALLPLAAQLAALPASELPVDAASLYSVGWSHGREEIRPGQPDKGKGSFYANPLTENLAQALRERNDGPADVCASSLVQEHPEFFAPNVWPSPPSVPQLRPAFCAMGRLLQEVGIQVAQVCDVYCQQHGVSTNLESVIRNSLNAKGRLLHYFAPPEQEPAVDNDVASDHKSATMKDDSAKDDAPWCAWHNDHGALTGLVPGMFLDAQHREVVCPDPEHCGLFIQPRGDCNGGQSPVKARLPDDHCAFQIGETAQILSGGLLQATPHAVLHSISSNNNNNDATTTTTSISRESFAVFLEPEFDAPLDVPPGKRIEDCQGDNNNNHRLGLRPLSARWKSGQNFGDFHLATVSAFAVTD